MELISSDGDIGGRLPRGPHQLAPEYIAADQRRRLVEAMVQCAGFRGYRATSVSDLIKSAGVSRKTFYELFPSREQLLKLAFESSLAAFLEAVAASAEGSGGPTPQLEALTRHLCHRAVERPDMVALWTVEIGAAGTDGFALRADLMASYATLLQDCLSSEDKLPLPYELALTLAGALSREIAAWLGTGRASEMADLAAQLARWARCYHPVPPDAHLREAVEPGSASSRDGLGGGRAPGTLTLAPHGYVQPIGRLAPGFLAHLNRERILDAVALLNAERGFSSLTVETIVARADLPERAFRANFASRDEAVATAVELGHAKAQAIVERARAGCANWREGVCQATRALLEFLASEPDFTRLALVDAPLAGPAMSRRSFEHASAYARLIFDGAPKRRNPPTATPEIIVHALFELAYSHATDGRIGELTDVGPEATYLALAPYLGVIEAAEVDAEFRARTLVERGTA